MSLLAVGAPAFAVDLIGTWFVLVHYKDSTTTHPERERWEDRIWEFKKVGDRLEWADYPIVVFEDQTGRFSSEGTAQKSRVLAFWEPSPAQRAQIQAGLEINPRGSRTKTLKGSEAKGWTSAKKKGGYQSARFITFTETWTIEGSADLPHFIRDDVMGSASTDSFEGRTAYRTTSVENGELRGEYDRDGTRKGTFRMMRSGEASTVKGRAGVERDGFYQMIAGGLSAGMLGGELSEEQIRAAIDAGTFTEDDRRRLRTGFEAALSEQFQAQGNDPRQVRGQIQGLARKMTALFVDEGMSLTQIQEQMRQGRLVP